MFWLSQTVKSYRGTPAATRAAYLSVLPVFRMLMVGYKKLQK